jgi:conjugal transfer pilus assembly protein TraD
MSAAVFQFHDPFRPIYEYYAALAWAAAVLVCAAAIVFTDFPSTFFILFGAFCALMAGLRGIAAIKLYKIQSWLHPRDPVTITVDELADKIRHREEKGLEPALFLGYGFTWSQEHTQLVHTITRNDPSKLLPSVEDTLGQSWIHGIGMDQEEELWVPLAHTAGHMLLAATTRAGKTRELDLICSQAVLRGESILVFDPKGDADLYSAIERAYQAAGRPNDFVFFHPSFPERSWRIDPLSNFSRATELASRIASLISSEPGAEVFTAFPMKILTNLAEGMLLIDDKPTLAKFKRYVDSGPEKLVIAASETYFEKNVPNWRVDAEPFTVKARNKGERELALAYITFYRDKVQVSRASPVLEGLYGDFEHEKAHMVKLIAGLSPILTMLTAGTLNELLSPDATKDDDRPITDFARIIRNGQGCYVGLDSLSDNMVGTALGSMFVSDLTAVAGARYNYSELEKVKPVNVIIDESAELVSDKLIQLLNKAGGAKLRLIIATQTFADFAAKVGSSDKARQTLGNLNNKLAGRLVDFETQEYITEAMPQTYVRHIEYTQQTDARTDNMMDFGYRMSEAMKETEVPLVPAQLLSCLPSGEFFAQVSAGRVIKIRAPLLVHQAAA